MTARLLEALARGAASRARVVVAVAIAAALGAGALALRLHPTAATSTFVSSSSRDYDQTQRFYRAFGEEPVQVLVSGDLQQLVLSADLQRLLGLEGCLSGNVPIRALPAVGGVAGPCGRLARAHTVKVVLGPGTFINEAADQINAQLEAQTKQAAGEARQAERAVRAAALARGLGAEAARTLGRQAAKVTIGRFQESLAVLALQYGLTGRPSLNDRNFVSTLVFDSSKPAGTPKQRFAYLFPARNAALVSVRMRAGLSEAQRTHTIALIRQAVAMPQWRLQHGEGYLVTGEPVIVADLTHSITRSVELLLIAVLLVMAGTLSLIFSGRPRLLPLATALLATALTFGGLSLAGGSLAMAEVAVLPVLVGLAVDYAIQFQARVHEEGLPRGRRSGGERAGLSVGGAGPSDEGADPSRAGAGPSGGGRSARVEAIARGAAAGGPTIATAAAATAGAMLVLLLSPVPMVRGFGLLLVIGLAIAFLCAFTAGAAALGLAGGSLRPRWLAAAPRRGPGAAAGAARGRPHGARRALAAPRMLATHFGPPLGAAWRGARELLLENRVTRFASRMALEGAVRSPARVLGVGLALAALGWGLDTQTRVETDITKLVPQGMGSLQNLNALERATGVGGEIDLMVGARNVATPAAIEWMGAYQRTVLARFGYSAARGCGRARLCPAFSLPDLFSGQASGLRSTPKGKRARLTSAQVGELLAAIPPYFSQDVISADRRNATLAFGIRLMSLADQQQLIDQMRAQLHPPRGVTATLVGLPVLAAASGTQVASVWRRMLTLVASVIAVALVLLIAFRGDRRRALVPLVPIALATGWSSLVLFCLRVPLNPMSVTLGALVVAVSTEFSVLLAERHRQERLAGHDALAALRRTYQRTGSAVLASGVTAVVGFGVLALSDIRMLRDFGLVTLVDLTVSLLGVLVALPAALSLAGAGAQGAPRRRLSAAGRARGELAPGAGGGLP